MRMPAPAASLNEEFTRALAELAELRRFTGPPKEFWQRYLACVGAICAASKVVLLVRDAEQPARWRRLVEWSATSGPSRFLVAFAERLDEIAAVCADNGRCLLPLEPHPEASGAAKDPRGANPLHGATRLPSPALRPGHYVIGSQLRLLRAEEPCLITGLLSEVNEPAAREALLRLTLAADTPEAYQTHQLAHQARQDVEKFAAALDLMVAVNAEKKFLAAALAFCNGLATRFRCDRVSLGWLQGGYVKLRAMSRTEKFNRQMAAARALEIAMEEAIDQDDEILWPAPPEATVVARDHAQFAKDQGVPHLCSLPLRADTKPVAVTTCERQSAPFTSEELQQLRLCADQVARRLADLKHHDRWFGARWASNAREQFAKVLGPEHTWAKVLAIVLVAALAVVVFWRVPYRVEGEFILRSEEVAYLTSPFDGYIEQVHVRPGDVVAAGGTLLHLNTAELRLEESNALADWVRFQREAEKARATNALAEMRIALALADQAKARLDLVRYRLEQAAIRAPFDAVVVEGDLRERLGAPVKQGDTLFRVARTDRLYVEAQVDERDVHEILTKSTGEIAFVSQPKLKFPVRLLTVEPAAIPKEKKNVFLVRCAMDGPPQRWWRPGMSGVCKLNVEKRTLLWIITHRTVDFLRMWLWW